MDLQRFRYYTAWHHAANEREYDAPADPWKLLRVDPAEVEHYTNEIKLNWGLGRVEGGGWDREGNRAPVSEIPIYRGLKQRFEQGRDWEETALYRRRAEQFEDGETVRGYDSLAAFRRVRLAYLDDLFRSVERDGYRPNREGGHDPATGDNPFEDAYAHHLEPLVVVGRDGEVLWTEGYHRLVIAEILDIGEIPVLVLCRHEAWQRVRDRMHGAPAADRPADLDAHAGHPDLRDVRP